MPDRNGFPAGVPCFIDLSPPDPEAATRFYGALFGWTFEDRMPPEAPGHFFAARLDGREVTAISSQPTDDAAGRGPPTSRSTAPTTSRAGVRDAGGTVLAGPFDVFDAGRMAVCADPQGAAFCLWQPGRHPGAEIVNAPGSWNWSDLKTPDTDAAKAFYGAVFGWESTDLDFGGRGRDDVAPARLRRRARARATPTSARRQAGAGAPRRLRGRDRLAAAPRRRTTTRRRTGRSRSPSTAPTRSPTAPPSSARPSSPRRTTPVRRGSRCCAIPRAPSSRSAPTRRRGERRAGQPGHGHPAAGVSPAAASRQPVRPSRRDRRARGGGVARRLLSPHPAAAARRRGRRARSARRPHRPAASRSPTRATCEDAIGRCRRLLDLDADPVAIDAQLGARSAPRRARGRGARPARAGQPRSGRVRGARRARPAGLDGGGAHPRRPPRGRPRRADRRSARAA